MPPYFVAVAQHSILGDYLTSGGTGLQLLCPITPYGYGLGMEVMDLTNIFVEWILFLAFLAIMFKTKDVRVLFQHHVSNMLLSVPILTTLLPVLLSFPISVPLELVIPHAIYLVLFAASVLIDFRYALGKLLD